MGDSLIRALDEARARLNATIVAHRALAWAGPAAVAAGLAVAGLRALGVGAAGLPLWATAVAAFAAAGAVSAWRSRITRAGAARWLDERLSDKELLSAALVCLARGSSERFDAEIVERARGLVPFAAGLRASSRPIAKRAAIAAAACAVGAYLVFLASPLAGSMASASPRAGGPPGAAPEGAAAAAADAIASGGSASAAAFAASLFPDDKRRATLAERALREGRIDELGEMLKAADLEYDSRLSRSVSEPERKKLASERERIREAAKAIAMANSSAAAGARGKSRGDPGEDGRARGDSAQSEPYAGGSAGGSAPGAGGNRGAGPPGDQGAAPGRGSRSPNAGDAGDGADGGPSEPGKGGGGVGGAGGNGGSNYGSGSGSEGAWGRIEPSAGAERADLESAKESSFFELVLPDQAASRPISRLVPDSRRSAESAMSREGVPLEYEEFVRSYFMALSKGESR